MSVFQEIQSCAFKDVMQMLVVSIAMRGWTAAGACFPILEGTLDYMEM